eukprot:CCRYP_014734-RA/>CCRYP_014734-RA protein AED:0.23 eAED:0.23 QI:0/-1/0/1/-1/1/1/0/571
MVVVVQKPADNAILYIDHANHLTPLTLTYHATSARHLTSGRTDVIPPSTSVEVDSAYCPRCLTYCDVASASLGFCQVDLDSGSSSSAVSCKDCPVCFSPLAISIDDVGPCDASAGASPRLICQYLCGHCQWSSRECGVTSNADKLLELRTDQSDAARENDLEKQRQMVIADASKQLELCLRQKLESKNRVGDELFQSLCDTWKQKEKNEERKRRLGLGTLEKSNAINLTNEKSWSLGVLEQALEEKKKSISSTGTVKQVANNSNVEATDGQGVATSKSEPVIIPTPQQVAAQMAISTATPRLRSDLFPLPVPFNARVSRRCLAEQAAGRTGILVKPKLNPLEGDSSLRAGHGQWYKKDSSAVHVVPRVQICTHGSDSTRQRYAMLLKVRNPTLSMVRLRFSSPSLSKRDDGAGEQISTIPERELQNIPIDPFSETFVNARICSPSSTDSLVPTEWLVLENAIDLFLDMGKGQEEDPIEVRDWDPSSVLDSTDCRISKFRVLATRKDTAWVELVLSTDYQEVIDSKRLHLAIPIAMQIEVGNGSWDASLIKKRDLQEDSIDFVTLNLVALLS